MFHRHHHSSIGSRSVGHGVILSTLSERNNRLVRFTFIQHPQLLIPHTQRGAPHSVDSADFCIGAIPVVVGWVEIAALRAVIIFTTVISFRVSNRHLSPILFK